MPAKINLLPRKEFEITLEDGAVIKGQFGTWALKRFCDKRSLSLTDAGEQLATLGGLIDYVLCAVEYSARKTGSPFSFTDINACDWIDALGGTAADKFTSLINHTRDETGEVEQKKTEAVT